MRLAPSTVKHITDEEVFARKDEISFTHFLLSSLKRWMPIIDRESFRSVLLTKQVVELFFERLQGRNASLREGRCLTEVWLASKPNIRYT